MESNKSKHGYGFMDIKYTSINHEVSSVVFGNGSIRVTTIYNPEENTTGISLCDAPENRPVGELYIVDGVAKDPEECPLYIQKNAKFQMLFDNVNSIDVVINRLTEARERLVKQQLSNISI